MMKLSREPLALPKVDYEDVSEVKATIIVNDSFSILYLQAIRSPYSMELMRVRIVPLPPCISTALSVIALSPGRSGSKQLS